MVNKFTRTNPNIKMDKFLKPKSLDISPNSPLADRDFKHWYHSFSALICRSTLASGTDKLDALVPFVSPSVYEYIMKYNEYETTLKSFYIKPINEVFVRHTLAVDTKGKTS